MNWSGSGLSSTVVQKVDWSPDKMSRRCLFFGFALLCCFAAEALHDVPASSNSTNSTETGTSPVMVPVSECGREPHHEFAHVEQRNLTFLKYRCNDGTEPVSFPTVVCYSDKTWSKLPVCRGTCVLYAADYQHFVKMIGTDFLSEGDTRPFWCDEEDHVSYLSCVNGTVTRTECCHLAFSVKWCEKMND
ncbi:uncharacterized protein V6R79_020361 [Siganus canaliculatus]